MNCERCGISYSYGTEKTCAGCAPMPAPTQEQTREFLARKYPDDSNLGTALRVIAREREEYMLKRNRELAGRADIARALIATGALNSGKALALTWELAAKRLACTHPTRAPFTGQCHMCGQVDHRAVIPSGDTVCITSQAWVQDWGAYKCSDGCACDVCKAFGPPVKAEATPCKACKELVAFEGLWCQPCKEKRAKLESGPGLRDGTGRGYTEPGQPVLYCDNEW